MKPPPSNFHQNQFIVLPHQNFITMKKIISLSAFLITLNIAASAQESHHNITIPVAVKKSLNAKYPHANKITWEKENGNYEANWGGKSGEDHSVQFTPAGDFVEIVDAIAVNQLPGKINVYAKNHLHSSKITEAGILTKASGEKFYEVEIKGKDIIFDTAGNFIKNED